MVRPGNRPESIIDAYNFWSRTGVVWWSDLARMRPTNTTQLSRIGEMLGTELAKEYDTRSDNLRGMVDWNMDAGDMLKFYGRAMLRHGDDRVWERQIIFAQLARWPFVEIYSHTSPTHTNSREDYKTVYEGDASGIDIEQIYRKAEAVADEFAAQRGYEVYRP